MVYYDQDLGSYAQMFWNLSRGSSYSSTLGEHFLRNHLTYVFYPLTFFYFFFQHPFFLLGTQSLCLALGGFFTYKIANNYLNPTWALFLGVLYFLYPPVGFINLYEFHPIVYAIPFLFLTIHAYIGKRFWAFVIFSLWAMSCQENISIAILIFSVLAFFDSRQRRWILYPALSAISWALVSFVLIQPLLGQHYIWSVEIYDYLGTTWFGVIKNFFTQPDLWLPKLCSLDTGVYFIQLFFPLLFLPLISWKALLFLAPYLFQHILSVRTFEASVYYHYTAEMLPFLFWGAAMGLSMCLKKFKGPLNVRVIRIMFISAIVLANIITSPYAKAIKHYLIVKETQDLNFFKKEFLKAIPKSASIVATTQFFPSLANRSQLYSLYYVYRRQKTTPKSTYTPPQSIDYALIDINDVFISQSFDGNLTANFFDFLNRYPWTIVDYMEDVILMKRGIGNIEKLVLTHPRVAKPPDLLINKNYNDEILLEGVNINYNERQGHRIAQLQIYWQALDEPKHKYKLLIGLADESGAVVKTYHHHIAYGFYPTNYWEAGQRIIENYQLVLPKNLWDKELNIKVSISDENDFEKAMALLEK